MRVYPDTAAANAPLLKFERDARREEIGLWRAVEYCIPYASDLPKAYEGFQLVRGQVSSMRGAEGFGAVCDLSLRNSALRLQIQTGAASLCQEAPGLGVLARGYVRGDKIEISYPLNFELVETPTN